MILTDELDHRPIVLWIIEAYKFRGMKVTPPRYGILGYEGKDFSSQSTKATGES